MPIRVLCDCGAKLVAGDHLARKQIRCPTCRQLIRLPDSDPDIAAKSDTGISLESDSILAAELRETLSSLDEKLEEAAESRPLTQSEWERPLQPPPIPSSSRDSHRPSVPKRRPKTRSGRDGTRPAEVWFWILAVGGLAALVGMAILANEFDSRLRYWDRSRFLTDNAHGATANAVESIDRQLQKLDKGSAVMRFCSFCMLWLIFLSLLRINSTIRWQTEQLVMSIQSGPLEIIEDTDQTDSRLDRATSEHDDSLT